MIVFYWVAGIVIALVALPSAIYFALYLATGEPACDRRARIFGRWTATLALAAFDILIFKHVVGGLIEVMR
jgi:hypothetical protein